MKYFLLLLGLITAIACSNALQTSSGAAFLADRGPIGDNAVMAAVAGEPNLHFPAKIGIARIIGGDITAQPQTERDIFIASRPTPDPLGEFVQASPMIAQTIPDVTPNTVIRRAQLTAARQHLDYVLIYTLTREGGGFGAMGRAEAVLRDVRSGYIYATASTSTHVAGYSTIRRGWGNRVFGYDAAAKVVSTLAPDMTDIFTTLYQPSLTN